MFQKKKVHEPVPEYDFERDGSLVTPEIDPSYTIAEAYWTRPGLALTVIAVTPANEYQYLVFEPSLTPFEKMILERLFIGVRDILIQKDTALEEESKTQALDDAMDAYLQRFEIELEPGAVHKIRYYLRRNYLGWSILEPLQNDLNIEDISCDGANTPIFLYHRKYWNIRTSIIFENAEALDAMVVLLAQKTGKQISISSPIVDTTLADGSRAQLTYGKTVSSHGSSFTIRKFRKVPYSPIDLIRNKTFTVEEMVFFWMAVEYNQSILFIGGTASGKTTSLNAVAQFIPHLSKIITIEDTREITLSHQNWLASVVPDTTNISGGDRAPIEMFDLLKAAMRQRPEYILVGEVRGIEARTLFQAMNTGHTTFSTLHAGSVDSAIYRLENQPLNVPRPMIESLNIVSSQVRLYRDGKQIRRCNEIVEIVGISETNDIIVNSVFKYRPETDTPVYSARSEMYTRIAEISGKDMSWISQETLHRTAVIQAMIDQRIQDYRDVSEILWKYHSMPERVLASLEDLSVLLENGIRAPTLYRNMKADLDKLQV